MTATLYAIPGSHALRAGALMLEHKGIDQLRSPDFAIASSLALAEYVLELRAELQRRPLGALLDRVFSGSAAARGPR